MNTKNCRFECNKPVQETTYFKSEFQEKYFQICMHSKETDYSLASTEMGLENTPNKSYTAKPHSYTKSPMKTSSKSMKIRNQWSPQREHLACMLRGFYRLKRTHGINKVAMTYL